GAHGGLADGARDQDAGAAHAPVVQQRRAVGYLAGQSADRAAGALSGAEVPSSARPGQTPAEGRLRGDAVVRDRGRGWAPYRAAEAGPVRRLVRRGDDDHLPPSEY